MSQEASNTPESTPAAATAAPAAARKAGKSTKPKKRKPLKEPPPLPKIPTPGACVFGGGVTLLLGALLAALHLATRPVERVAQIPAQPDPAKVYVVTGSADDAKAQRWLRKRQRLLDGPGGEVRVTEDDINVWAQNSLVKGAPEGMITYAPDIPNFRLQDGSLHIALQGDVNLFGLKRPVVVQTHGKFSGKSYAIDDIRIGQLPAGVIPGLRGQLLERLDAAYPAPSDLAEAWSRLGEVSIDDKTLVLKVP